MGVRKALPWLALAAILLGVFALRIRTFFMSTVYPDESLFLLMGREWLRGALPYTTVWDHHPVGGAAFFAAAQWAFGQSVLAIRLLTVIVVAAECLLLFRLGEKLSGRGKLAGLIAAGVYAVYSLNNEGLAANRELIFAPLITLCLYLWVTRPGNDAGRAGWGRLLVIGLLMGVGLQLKYLYFWDCLAVVAIVTWDLLRVRRSGAGRPLVDLLRAYCWLALGPLLVVGLVALYFGLHGQFQAFFQANFVSGATYAGSHAWETGSLLRVAIGQIRNNLLLWLGLGLAPLYLAFDRGVSERERRSLIYLGLWLVFALVDVFFTGNLFRHYFLQLLPPLCLITGLLVVGLVRAGAPGAAVRQGLLVTLVLLPPLFSLVYSPLVGNASLVYRHFVGRQPWPSDTPTAVAAYIREHGSPDQPIFIMDYEPIVYYLVDAPLPTRYVFTPHLMDAVYREIGRFDQVAELDAIMAQKPVYVVRLLPRNPGFTNEPVAARLDVHLSRDYNLERTIAGVSTTSGQPVSVVLYRRLRDH